MSQNKNLPYINEKNGSAPNIVDPESSSTESRKEKSSAREKEVSLPSKVAMSNQVSDVENFVAQMRKLDMSYMNKFVDPSLD